MIGLVRPWSRAILATILVAVLPVAAVWALWALGVVTSLWITVPLALGLALLASFAGAAVWRRRPAAGDVLFSDLLLWGWLRRARAEHRLADAVELLGRAGADGGAENLRTLERVADAIDAKDPYLDGHSRRVAGFSSRMARRLGLPDDEAERVRTAAAIHDVGKLHVPPEILAKPDALTPAESEAVRRHADEGAAMVACLGEPGVTDIVRHHHERFDGGGYPAGLSGEAIPLGARIVAVADTFDAITSVRPYRPAGTHKRALEVLTAEAGAQLDPVVVRAFVRDYARRRGLLLWALLAQPVATARRHPLPAAVVLGGLVVLGAAATAVHLGRSADPPAAAAPPPPTTLTIAAPPTHAREASTPAPETRRHRTQRVVIASSARATQPAKLVAAVAPRLRPRSTAQDPLRRATQHESGAQRRGTAAPQPRPRDTQRPHAPPPTTAPRPAAASPPPASTPAPTSDTPASTPSSSTPLTSTPTPPPAAATPSPPPAPTGAGACKNGGYVAGGYRNQGQCVSSSHRP